MKGSTKVPRERSASPASVKAAVMMGLCLLAGAGNAREARGQESVLSFTRPGLTLEGARRAGEAAVDEARRIGAPGGAFAVVDDGGHLLYLVRLDGTFPAASDIATAKARTAALFRRPTSGLEDAIVAGRATLLNVAEAPLQGGVPLLVDGHVVGAIGVSGAASAAQDTELATAGAAAMPR